MSRLAEWRGIIATLVILVGMGGWLETARGDVTREEVERAIKDAVRFLIAKQAPDGSWRDFQEDFSKKHGLTSLATLALLNAGESPRAPHIVRALQYVRSASPAQLDNTYAVSLQAMALAAGDPERDRLNLIQAVKWLERAQFKANDGSPQFAGSWTYSMNKGMRPDNSNCQFALLGLHAAAEAGIPVDDKVWTLARNYWERAQHGNGSWGYLPNDPSGLATMTCAGISSMVITGQKRVQSTEVLVGDTVRNCGEGGVVNARLQAAIHWIGQRFQVGGNFSDGGFSHGWKFYYLYGLERAGRLSGQRYFGRHDWYRAGAEKLVREQDKLLGSWRGSSVEESEVLATSMSLLFLAKGRSPVLINKIVHDPQGDWNIHIDDVRNLTAAISRDWKTLLTWQTADPNSASVEDLLQAPVLFINGKQAPEFTATAKANLRSYVEQGGFIFAEAGCSEPEFDRGFRALVKELFPEDDYKLKPLREDHPIWRARHQLNSQIHPLEGIEFGCRTVLVYTPKMLGAYWNHAESQPNNLAVEKAVRVGQNVIDYATGRELPPDKLAVREVRDFKADTVKRGALRIAKLRHAGDWNIAPLAIPNLTTALRDHLKFDVVISHKELFVRDPNLIYYPLIYIHGRANVSFTAEELTTLRRHLEPGGGVLFADAACGSEAFDTAFRRFAKELVPDHPLEPIPPDDEIYTTRIGYDLSNVQYSKAAGGRRAPAQLEGIKINNRWAVIYSKYDLGCALERHAGADCKGYDYESALKIASNIVIYSTLP